MELLVIGLIVVCIVITLIIYIIAKLEIDLSNETRKTLGFSFIILLLLFIFSLRILLITRPAHRGQKRSKPVKTLQLSNRTQHAPGSGSKRDDRSSVESIMARQDWTTPPDEDGLQMGYSEIGDHVEVVAHVGRVEQGQVTVGVLSKQVRVAIRVGPFGSDDENSVGRTIDIPITMDPEASNAEILGEVLFVSISKVDIPTRRESQMVKLQPVVRD